MDTLQDIQRRSEVARPNLATGDGVLSAVKLSTQLKGPTRREKLARLSAARRRGGGAARARVLGIVRPAEDAGARGHVEGELGRHGAKAVRRVREDLCLEDNVQLECKRAQGEGKE